MGDAELPSHLSGKYHLAEIFGPTLQGEGARAGTVNMWLRFAGCNLQCRATDIMGFDCDTDFEKKMSLTGPEIVHTLGGLAADVPVKWVVISGGEPGLQLDDELVDLLHGSGWSVAIETNGTRPISSLVDWISVSPKVAESELGIIETHEVVDELRYVRRHGQPLPQPRLSADHYCISPAWNLDGTLDEDNLKWCIDLVLGNPTWRLSCQQHKWWGVR